MSVEVPVEGTREMKVQRPVITNEVIEVEGVAARETIVHTQSVEDHVERMPEDLVSHKVKQVSYQTAQTVMKPTAVEAPVKVEGDVEVVGVADNDFVRHAAETCVTVSLVVPRSKPLCIWFMIKTTMCYCTIAAPSACSCALAFAQIM